MSGYVRIHRALLGHPSLRNDAECMAFAWMIIRAQWRDVSVRYKGRRFDLKRGQLAVSQRDMADALDRDKAWVERLWKRCRDEAMISVSYEAGSAVITICNYEQYQAETSGREAANDDAGEAVSEADARQTQGTEQRREEGKKKVSSEDKSSSDTPALRPEHIVEKWNEMAERHGLPLIRKLSPDRRRKMLARIRDHPLEDWLDAFDAIERNPWLHGDSRGGWRANIDFLLQPSSFQKLIEGNYDRSQSAHGTH
jgi:hypothetical protein